MFDMSICMLSFSVKAASSWHWPLQDVLLGAPILGMRSTAPPGDLPSTCAGGLNHLRIRQNQKLWSYMSRSTWTCSNACANLKPHLPCVDMSLTKYLISSQRSLETSYPMCHMCIEAVLALGNPTIILFPLPQMSARCKGPQVIEQHHRLPTVLPSECWTAVTCCHIVINAVFVRKNPTNWLCYHQFHLPLSMKLCWDITRLAPKGESHGKELNRLRRHQAYHGIQNQQNLNLWIHLEWPSEEALG